MGMNRLLSAMAVGALLAIPAAASAQTLNVVTAGDQNMVDYVNNYLGPKFEMLNPGVKVRAVGTTAVVQVPVSALHLFPVAN